VQRTAVPSDQRSHRVSLSGAEGPPASNDDPHASGQRLWLQEVPLPAMPRPHGTQPFEQCPRALRQERASGMDSRSFIFFGMIGTVD
jgi:hypothetical protein